MVCKKCGSTQPDSAKFCSNCGNIIEPGNNDMGNNAINTADVKQIEKEHAPGNQVSFAARRSNEQNTVLQNTSYQVNSTGSNRFKEKIKSFWSGLDLFSKIATVALVVVALLLFAGICLGKIIPIIIAILQLGVLIVSLLMHKGHIKCNLNWLKYVILAVSIIIKKRASLRALHQVL